MAPFGHFADSRSQFSKGIFWWTDISDNSIEWIGKYPNKYSKPVLIYVVYSTVVQLNPTG